MSTRTRAHVGDSAKYRANRNYVDGDKIAVTGVASDTVDLSAEDFDRDVTKIGLTTLAGGANDFDLPAGMHGQEVLVTLDAKNTDNATITPDAGVTVVQKDRATALASLTFDTVGEFGLFIYEHNRWVLLHTDATIA